MARTALRLLGIQELADLLGVSAMDVKNWRRRGKLPAPAVEMSYGPIWTPDQFPAKVRRDLTSVRTVPLAKTTTTRRSGKTRTATRQSTARTRKSSKR